MNLDQRYRNQIDQLINVLELIENRRQENRPVDRELSKLFRKNSHYGSKDRRFISGAIFGYFRWFGWLKKIDGDDKCIQLLLGYLLDNNPIGELTHFWINKCGFPDDWVLQFKKDPITINDKLKIMVAINPEIKLIDLNPVFVGQKSVDWIDAFQSRPKLWIRVLKQNNQRFFTFLKNRDIKYEIHEKIDNIIRIDSPINLHESIDFQQGQLEVQDISSQGVGYICEPKPGDIWWDVCAGSGGKSLHLAALMKNKGTIIATEIDTHMFRELNRRLKKNKHLKKIHPIFWDGEKIDFIEKPVQGVLVDAPCSCSGTWRRAPDLRWATSESDIEYYSKLQKSILIKASENVPVNSCLVYATCSIFYQENEAVIDYFLDKFPEFSLVEITHPFTQGKFREGIYLSPPEVDGNGMFVAKMIRN